MLSAGVQCAASTTASATPCSSLHIIPPAIQPSRDCSPESCAFVEHSRGNAAHFRMRAYLGESNVNAGRRRSRAVSYSTRCSMMEERRAMVLAAPPCVSQRQPGSQLCQKLHIYARSSIVRREGSDLDGQLQRRLAELSRRCASRRGLRSPADSAWRMPS